jgi:hypothetical protein
VDRLARGPRGWARVLGVGPNPAPAARKLTDWFPTLFDPALPVWIGAWAEITQPTSTSMTIE